jgi:deoxyguanosine kinase
MMNATWISIVGAVGAGKTTLAERLAADLGAKLLREDYASNPFLAESHAGNPAMVLPCQLHFLLARVAQLSEATRAAESEHSVFISDHGFCQTRIWAQLQLTSEELAVYDAVEQQLAPRVRTPDVIVVLDAPVAVLQQRIAGRGRAFESALTDDFLETLRAAHRGIVAPPGGRIIHIDVEHLDLRDATQRTPLLRQLHEHLSHNR